jgi:Arc/MetJ-type ribon-helix-helix transcriptional regulator
MQISLNQPELERFVEEQVKAGKFPSADALIAAAVADFQAAGDEALDDATLAAIEEGAAQAARGEGVDLEMFRARAAEWTPRT